MSNICVKVKNLSKRFFVLKKEVTAFRMLKALLSREPLKRELWALRDISFEIKKGEKLAIIGKNGAGKTALLRILTGIYDKTSGVLEVESVPKAIFKLSIGLNARLSVADNISLLGALHSIPKDVLKSKKQEILEIAELGQVEFSLLKKLSTGQQQRLALSVFFQAMGNFFIFDESTAFVDMGFAYKSKKYFERLFSPNTTLIMVSHDMSLLRRYCSKALWLDEGRIRMQGEVDKVIDEYERCSKT